MIFGVMTDVVRCCTVDHSQVSLVIEHARRIERIVPTLDGKLGVLEVLSLLLGILLIS